MKAHVKSQAALVTQLRAMLRDTGSARWTDAEVYLSLNLALDEWQGRVSTPMVYTLPDGLTAGVYEYSLPSYVRAPVRVQRLVATDGYPIEDDVAMQWADITRFEVEPDGEDGLTLRLRTTVEPDSEGRIFWTARAGRVPTTLPTLSAAIDADDTTLTVNAAVDVGDAGYVLIDNEWVQYAGLTRGASATTLLALVRGVNETTAATHSLGASVAWGVAAPTADLFAQLTNQTAANLHQLFLAVAAPNERDNHERQISFLQAKADGFWRRHTPARAPRLVL